MPLTTTVFITIYNEAGQELVHGKKIDEQNTFSVKNLENGIYFVEIHAQGKVFIEKLIVRN